MDHTKSQCKTVIKELMQFVVSMNFSSSISLTVGASRLMEAQMDLPHLLFSVGFQIFYSDASNVAFYVLFFS